MSESSVYSPLRRTYHVIALLALTSLGANAALAQVPSTDIETAPVAAPARANVLPLNTHAGAARAGAAQQELSSDKAARDAARDAADTLEVDGTQSQVISHGRRWEDSDKIGSENPATAAAAAAAAAAANPTHDVSIVERAQEDQDLDSDRLARLGSAWHLKNGKPAAPVHAPATLEPEWVWLAPAAAGLAVLAIVGALISRWRRKVHARREHARRERLRYGIQ